MYSLVIQKNNRIHLNLSVKSPKSSKKNMPCHFLRATASLSMIEILIPAVKISYKGGETLGRDLANHLSIIPFNK